MVDLVTDATVPDAYLAGFIGHKIWAKPEGKAAGLAQFYQLIDYWREGTGDISWPFRFMAFIDVDGLGCRALVAPKTYTKDVPIDLCTSSIISTVHGDVEWWELNSSRVDPVECVTRPRGWSPQPLARREPPVEHVEMLGEQFVLPI